MVQRRVPPRPFNNAASQPGGPGRPMMLEMVLMQMQASTASSARAREIGQLAFMQWLGGLPGGCDFIAAARSALARVDAAGEATPALDTFRMLLAASVQMPPQPLDLRLPEPRRRGGARARRMPL
ncbi:hypothetical protein [Rhodovulum euryhalinum]|uniref:Uncharacterized protein n=1 Tax=Rhodovulum euryhalinum TaxID=35805 RepID=A0A4R2KSU0_9RHOB|nr:hypothetical protein [Rhodovulum euryhalinum]TCO74116.1 hypothetical protein EV655_101275 [Rhodovulum euryhalinum]